MSEACDRVRRRYTLVQEVLGHVGRAGTSAVPQWQERIDAEYDGEGLGGFLRDVQRRWHRAFEARLDAELESDLGDPTTTVTSLWRTLAASQPATRLVLDEYDGHAALVGAEARHRTMLRMATGVDLRRLRVEQDPRTGEPARRTCRLTGLGRTWAVRRGHGAPQAV